MKMNEILKLSKQEMLEKVFELSNKILKFRLNNISNALKSPAELCLCKKDKARLLMAIKINESQKNINNE